MKLVDVSFWYDEHVNAPEALLEQHRSIEGLMKLLQKKGVEAVIVKRFKQTRLLENDGLPHHFIKDWLPAHLCSWQIPFKVIWFIRRQKPDMVQVHGFMFPMAILFLRLFCHKHTSIVIQHHAGLPQKGLKRILEYQLNSLADGYFFAARDLGLNWFTSKKQREKIFQLMEGSNFFNPTNKQSARLITGLQGNPIFLWVGRLEQNKDPLTLLKGFTELLKSFPSATLYMIYVNHPMLNEVQQLLASNEPLSKAVTLLGKMTHEQLEVYYNSADYFVLGSHREGSGFSLVEAMACGCIPIVTDIPSFRMITNEGNIGALWQAGDSESFVQAAKIALAKDAILEANNSVDFFKQELSYDAIADKAIDYYKKIIKQKLA